MSLRRLVSLAALAALTACSPGERPDAAEAEGEWIDLTHALGPDTIFWPTADPYVHEKVFAGTTEAGYYYSTYNLALSEHGGTHLDAPVHFAEGRQGADEVPLDRLIGPAAVIDVTAAAEADADYRVTHQDVLDWEEANGPLPEGAIVLVRTGFAKRWPDAASYLGTVLKGDAGVAALHFPGRAPACRGPGHRRRRHRHGEHRLRPIPRLHRPPGYPGTQHPRVRERRRHGGPAGDGRHGRRASGQGGGWQRRALAHRRPAAGGLICRPPLPIQRNGRPSGAAPRGDRRDHR